MTATEAFQDVLQKIQTCSLNYRMEISPFSATIHLRNSFIKDKNGNPLVSSVSDSKLCQRKSLNDQLYCKIQEQENTIRFLQTNHEKLINDCEKLYKSKTKLEADFQALYSRLEASEFEAAELLQKVVHENHSKAVDLDVKIHLENEIKEQKVKVSEIVIINKRLDTVAKNLQKELIEAETKSKNEVIETRKEFKAEIKAWRKDLGEERKAKIKLERQLEELTKNQEKENPPAVTLSSTCSTSIESVQEEISCMICAQQIPVYIPKFFHGIEINPSCESCQDSSISSDSEDKHVEENIDKENEEEMDKVRMEIRSRVRKKLGIRFRNGDISQNAMIVLEEELVKELQEELSEDLIEKLAKKKSPD